MKFLLQALILALLIVQLIPEGRDLSNQLGGPFFILKEIMVNGNAFRKDQLTSKPLDIFCADSGSADPLRLGMGEGILKTFFFLVFIVVDNGVLDLERDLVMGPFG